MILAMCLMHAGYSCQPLYTSGLIATMNLFWASLPIIAFACLEQASRSSLCTCRMKGSRVLHVAVQAFNVADHSLSS